MPEGLSAEEVGREVVRYALIGVGGLMLVVSLVQLTQLPGVPT
jgi:hypothetical protein